MRILVYTANFAPEPTGIGKYSGEMSAWLARAGHQVRVVAAPPYYPHWQVAPEHRGKIYSREQRDGVDVWRAPLWVPRQLSGQSRSLHLLSFALSSLPVVLWQAVWRPDVVVTVAPYIACAPAGWLTARLCGAKAWLHVQDFEVDVGLRLGMVNDGIFHRVLSAFERWLMRRFDRVSSISQRMLGRAEQKGVSRARLVYFPNWVDANAIRPLGSASRYRKDLGLPDEAVVALFSGTLGAKQGLQVIAEVARRLVHVVRLVFVICGDGVLKPQLLEMCRGLPNVHFLPLQPVEELGELLGMADIHLLTQSPAAQDLVMPSKLAGMLASGRPVVGTCNRDTEIAAVVGEFGLVTPPNDAAALAAAIEELASQPERRARMGAGARRYAQAHLAIDAVLGRFNTALVGIAGP